MKDSTPQTIYLKDYKAPSYFITDADLTFDLDETSTKVTSRYKVKRNPKEPSKEMFLNGEELKFISLKINNEEVAPVVKSDGLTFSVDKEEFELEVVNEINPSTNKALEGLYKSGSIFCTQNEPEGFRRITYFVDRPDNMTVFKTTIRADKTKYPILLSNGNPTESGDLENNHHFVSWSDPFPKPSYLFALVAGDLALVSDTYTTGSERKIDLRIYCDKGNEDKCHWAMESLKKSMEWDEKRYGLEYDLDIYMIVAVDAFNMGAMENKGLNIFNTKAVLADSKMATDENFMTIESIIGHEYFHNWTGNRVTCRDWFQLTLKEGLTVYRDQEFSSDLNNRTVQRIKDVGRLREAQFAEDQGPTAHPIKPSSYMEINNFYTATVYEKGAEVIRMYETLLGRDGFRKGMDKYFELFDGQAVRTEDFLHAMSVANNNFDFSQFQRWYHQAGTPKLKINTDYNSDTKEFKLTINQILSPSPGQEKKDAYYIPLRMGLLDKNGKELSLKNESIFKEDVLIVKDLNSEFVFKDISEKPTLSINRDFSAPVILDSDLDFDDYLHLLKYDSNHFNKYESSQNIYKSLFKNLLTKKRNNEELKIDEKITSALKEVLLDQSLDDSFKSLFFTLPSYYSYLSEQEQYDIENTIFVSSFIKKNLSLALKDDLIQTYKNLNTDNEFNLSAESMGKRALKNCVLDLLMELNDKEVTDLCLDQYKTANNMTDELSALSLLAEHDEQRGKDCLDNFYKKWESETLVMQKWMSVQVSIENDRAYSAIEEVEKSKVFDITIPNIARALYGAFAANLAQFHHPTGRGYQLLADRILKLNEINPQVSARLSTAFKSYAKLPENLKELMGRELKRIKDSEGLSKNVYEIISKTLV